MTQGEISDFVQKMRDEKKGYFIFCEDKDGKFYGSTSRADDKKSQGRITQALGTLLTMDKDAADILIGSVYVALHQPPHINMIKDNGKD